MSSTGGDASSRLESALADVFERTPRLPDRDRVVPPATTDDDWGVDDEPTVATPPVDPAAAAPTGVRGAGRPVGEPTETYELPEIIPATPSHPTEAVPEVRSNPAPQPVAPARVAPPGASPSHSPPATSWSDHMSTVPAGTPAAQLRAPGRRPRVRRVTRVVRHVDPWSTFKVAVLFSFVGYLVVLTSGVLLWRVADATGTLDNVERWFTQFGWETFEFDGSEIFRNAWVIGLFAAVALTGAIVLLATLFNLVSDIVGGVRVSVLEEEVVERTASSTRRYVVRRTPTTETTSSAADWDVDGDEPPAAAPSSAAATPDADDWSVDDADDPAARGSGGAGPRG